MNAERRTGDLLRVTFSTLLYMTEDMEDQACHFPLREGDVATYLGEEVDKYLKVLARGTVGWLGDGAYEWL